MVFDIQGAVINLTRDLNDDVRTSIAATRVGVDAIYNPTDKALPPDPGSEPQDGAGRGGNGRIGGTCGGLNQTTVENTS